MLQRVEKEHFIISKAKVKEKYKAKYVWNVSQTEIIKPHKVKKWEK